ncbi:3-carboxy-cis,cis-muconate cycloisomerase [Streptacidiphilus melanogenes]|uniref:3-carboxy-cis,cis-muconate cycloisomerase n=1 Tax=Streptacidiphilus melanogenes TaxID=411235 RepID=UPI0005AAB189|nr:3-carboxy-cis,cis-muconate cycloisomerase [Streptacidiphilus melanogenes]
MDAADLGLLNPVGVGSPAAALTGDPAFLRAMLEAEAALTRAQAALGVVSADAADAVAQAAARRQDFDVRSLALRAQAGGNPVIPLVADLRAAVPAQHADAVHRGATSQDILDTATMLVAARVRSVLRADLDRIADRLAVLAAEHRATPMPGRTLTQHAVPTSFGLKAAGWRSLVLDARDRLAALCLPAQLGGAAGTLAAFGPAGPALADRFADELGLDRPSLPWHVLRTPVAELGASLALVGGALGKLAADVLVLSRTEIGELAEGSGGGSSAMPHKANPVRAALIASAARQLPALASVLFSAMTAEDERPAGAWHAEWQPLREALRLAAGAAAHAVALVDGLHADTARMRAHLDLTRGLIVSERLLDALAPALGRGTARAVVTAASREAVADGVELGTALARQPELAARSEAAPPQAAPSESAPSESAPSESAPSESAPTADAADAHAVPIPALLDPTGYLGAAPELTDRALRRQPAPDEPRPVRPDQHQDLSP